MQKIGSLYVGGIDSLKNIEGDNFAIVHATKTVFNSDLDLTNRSIYKKDSELFWDLVDSGDTNDFNLDDFKFVIRFMDEKIEEGFDILVHCDFGVSRSASLVFLYLAKRTDYLPDNFNLALKIFSNEYPKYNPGGILSFIRDNWGNF